MATLQLWLYAHCFGGFSCLKKMSPRLIVTVIRHLPALSAKDCRSSLILENRLAIGIPKERVVLALANIQAPTSCSLEPRIRCLN